MALSKPERASIRAPNLELLRDSDASKVLEQARYMLYMYLVFSRPRLFPGPPLLAMFGDLYPEDCSPNCTELLIDVLVLQFEFCTNDQDKLYVPFRRMVGLLGQFGYVQYDWRQVVRMTAILVHDCDTRLKYDDQSGFRLLRALYMLRHIELVHRYGRSVFPPAFEDEEEERRRCILVLHELAPHNFWDGVSG